MVTWTEGKAVRVIVASSLMGWGAERVLRDARDVQLDVRGVHLVDEADVALVIDLVVQPPDGGLVRFRHGSPRSPRILGVPVSRVKGVKGMGWRGTVP